MTIILIFPYQIVTLRYKWWVERYYDYYTYEKYTYSAALLAIMIGPSSFPIKQLFHDIIDDFKILSFTCSHMSY